MSSKGTRNSKQLKTNQSNAIKSKNVDNPRINNNNTNSIIKNGTSSTTNVTKNNQNTSSVKTNNTSSVKTTGGGHNQSIGNKPIDNAPKSNLGSLKTNNTSSVKTTGGVHNQPIGNKSINMNVNVPKSNLGSLKTNNTSSIKTTGGVHNQSIGSKPIDMNFNAPRTNLSRIKTGTNAKLNIAGGVHDLPVNNIKNNSSFVKNVGVNIKTNIKTNISKFAQGRVLDSARLDTNHHNEIGSNTLKGSYNAIVKTKRGLERTVKTAKQIKRLPSQYRETKIKIKNIPSNIRTKVDGVKRTSKVISNSSKIIISNVRKGELIRALKEVPIRRIGKASLKGASKVLIKSSVGSKRLTLKGFNHFGRSLKKSALSKADESSDIGSNVIFGAIDTIEKTLRTGVKGTRTVRNASNKIKTIKNRHLKSTKAGTIKTKNLGNLINKKVKYHFNKFKASHASKKAIKKYVNKLKDQLRKAVSYIMHIIIKNPVVLGIIALILVMSFMFSAVLNAVLGFHASYFISIENPTQWITNMNKMDSDLKRRVNDHEHVRIVRDSGTKADWKDVIIAYYMKNNGSSSLNGGATTSLGNGATSVDPQTWDNVYKELQSYLGTDYYWGGSDPSTGFDCSGLVQYCYSKYGVSLPRTTYEQVLSGTHVEEDDMKAGDLVFFGNASDIHHVGVYIGNGQYIHAPQTGDVVKVSDLSSRTDFYEARRVFEVKEGTGSSSSTGSTGSTDKILYTALPNNKDLVDIFYKVEQETGVDAVLLASIAMTESSLNPNDVSSAGASGLCQLMPATFTELGFDIKDIFDPYTNVLACASEVKQLYSYSCISSVSDMLTAYNGGIGNFMRYSGPIPNNSENGEYSGKVLNYYTQLSNGQQPATMEGGTTNASNRVNTTLAQTYKAFVSFYSEGEGKHRKWILRYYTLEEALDNLGFSEEEKEEFYHFKDYNGDFDDDAEQFGEYDLDFKFKVK